MNLTKLSPGFGRSHAARQLPTPSALSPRSVHPTGHRDGGGSIQLRGAGHAGALAARRRRGEDLQPDWWGPGMVEGGNQRKSKCSWTMSHPISAPSVLPILNQRSLLSGQRRAWGHVPLPRGLFWLVDGLSSHKSHRCIARRCCVTVTRDAWCMQADGIVQWAGGHASSGDVWVCPSLNLHVGDV